MASAVDARRCYVVAGVCLLIAAAALRFYNLPGAAPGFDETRDAVRSRGTFSEVIEYTRYVHSSPILYPVALWAVQKAASTELSVRLMPAAASLLTVWALLFLMPRAGAGRWAAFLAALLAALSVAAIEHAQDGRVYSLDALIAALMIAGLLQYLRDGRKGLLCAALFAGPLLQYGLVLFGVAALSAAALASAAAAQTGRGGGRRSYGGAVWRHIRRRIGLLLPIGAFAAACGLSWALTTRYQWALGVGGAGGNDPGSFYLTDYYYQGGYDAAAMAEFAIGRTWGMLSYHMPPIIAGLALLAFGWLLLSMALRRRLDAVALLALLGVGIAICAALLGAYPYGHTRQSLYLGPIVFLAAGAAFHSVGVDAVGLARRKRPAAALAAAVAIALAGAWEIRQRQDYLYYSDASMKRVVAALEELEREGDGVYAATEEVIYLQFYKGAKPDNYRYGYFFCSEKSYARCVRQTLDEMFRVFNDSRRIWLIHNAGISAPKEIAAYSREGIAVEEYAADGGQSDYGGTLHGKPRTTLHLITGFEGLVAGARDAWVEAASGAAVVESDYSVYIRDNALYYARQPCVPSDVEAKFFLHVYPLDAGDLPPADRGAGFDNLDFNARDYDLWIGDKCLIRRALPDYYLIERIHTGQFMLDGGIVWEAEFPFDGWFNMYDEVTSGSPSAASIYDFYIRGNVLYYAKRPCAAADVDARFFLAIHPEDEADLPAERRRHGFDNLDFEFRDYGARDADKCLIRRALPDYPIERIHTGQFILDGPIIWESEFPFNP